VHKRLEVKQYMLGGWVNPHREQQTIPQGQTSIPPKSFSTPTANGQSAPRSGSARGVGRGAGSHTPSTASESFSQVTDGKVCLVQVSVGTPAAAAPRCSATRWPRPRVCRASRSTRPAGPPCSWAAARPSRRPAPCAGPHQGRTHLRYVGNESVFTYSCSAATGIRISQST